MSEEVGIGARRQACKINVPALLSISHDTPQKFRFVVTEEFVLKYSPQGIRFRVLKQH
jgi:hypothetical protein